MAFEPSSTLSSAEVISAWQRPIAVNEYHQMIDAGVFGEDDRIELLEGTLVRTSPQSIAHVHAIVYLTELLARTLPARRTRPGKDAWRATRA